jgi:hypothetical protein
MQGTARTAAPPCMRRLSLLVTQYDVTERARLETHLSDLIEAQLTLLSQVFPRHVRGAGRHCSYISLIKHEALIRDYILLYITVYIILLRM